MLAFATATPLSGCGPEVSTTLYALQRSVSLPSFG